MDNGGKNDKIIVIKRPNSKILKIDIWKILPLFFFFIRSTEVKIERGIKNQKKNKRPKKTSSFKFEGEIKLSPDSENAFIILCQGIRAVIIHEKYVERRRIIKRFRPKAKPKRKMTTTKNIKITVSQLNNVRCQFANKLII